MKAVVVKGHSPCQAPVELGRNTLTHFLLSSYFLLVPPVDQAQLEAHCQGCSSKLSIEVSPLVQRTRHRRAGSGFDDGDEQQTQVAEPSVSVPWREVVSLSQETETEESVGAI